MGSRSKPGIRARHTGRYLDPRFPRTTGATRRRGRGSAHFATGFSEKDRLRVAVSSQRTGFLVPDERLQFAAGQRQDRRNDETGGADFPTSGSCSRRGY